MAQVTTTVLSEGQRQSLAEKKNRGLALESHSNYEKGRVVNESSEEKQA